MLTVREVVAGDTPAFRETRLRALKLAPYAFGATYGESVTRPDSAWQEMVDRSLTSMNQRSFVADRGDGALAGMLYVQVNEDPPHDAYFAGMWVDEDLRGTSTASDLLRAAERFAYALGARAGELWVTETNHRAAAFYRRHGFVPTGLTEPQPSGNLALLYQKPDLDP